MKIEENSLKLNWIKWGLASSETTECPKEQRKTFEFHSIRSEWELNREKSNREQTIRYWWVNRQRTHPAGVSHCVLHWRQNKQHIRIQFKSIEMIHSFNLFAFCISFVFFPSTFFFLSIFNMKFWNRSINIGSLLGIELSHFAKYILFINNSVSISVFFVTIRIRIEQRIIILSE